MSEQLSEQQETRHPLACMGWYGVIRIARLGHEPPALDDPFMTRAGRCKQRCRDLSGWRCKLREHLHHDRAE